MPLSEHVYCVTVTFKMTEQVEKRLCIKFCIKLEHSSTETIQMIQKTAGMGTGDWQLHHATDASRRMQTFLAKHQITQVTQSPYSPDLVPSNFLAFPKTKITFEREEFQTIGEIQGNMMGQLMATGRPV